MIGPRGHVTGYGITRWAIQSTRDHGLKPLEAHVLLLLAARARVDDPSHRDFCKAWPSIETLALDCGLKVTRSASGAGRNSSISAALARLEELGLIWTTQGGNGRTARRELLYRGVDGTDAAPRPPRPGDDPLDSDEAPARETGPRPESERAEVRATALASLRDAREQLTLSQGRLRVAS